MIERQGQPTVARRRQTIEVASQRLIGFRAGCEGDRAAIRTISAVRHLGCFGKYRRRPRIGQDFISLGVASKVSPAGNIGRRDRGGSCQKVAPTGV